MRSGSTRRAAGSATWKRSEVMDFTRSLALQGRYQGLVPGAAHTYAKGVDQYPEGMAPFIQRGHGCRVWDVDGNEFIEYGMGLRSVTLGHGYERVVRAAAAQMADGTNFVRPAAIEVDCAAEMLALFAPGRMVKFAKNGSDATTAGVRLARAHTGRRLVAVCTDQPFFSVDDWFIGTTAMPAGIPEEIRALTVGFAYNNPASVDALFARHGEDLACVVLEAASATLPDESFLRHVQESCRANGSLLLLDEMITGFRWHVGGAQAYYALDPDLSTFGKGMGNGFSVAALVGRSEIMEVGGLNHDRERVFLLSTTHGAETHALVAARETIREYTERDVVGALFRSGERLRAGVEEAALRHGVASHFTVQGMASNLVYATLDESGERSQAFRTLFLQETISRGLLAPSLVVSFSHDDEAVDRSVAAIDGALEVYARALTDGIAAHLRGRPVKPTFRSNA